MIPTAQGRAMDVQQLQRRRDVLRAAREVMAGLGVTWQEVRAWALVDGGYLPADAPLRCPNPLVIDAYANRVGP